MINIENPLPCPITDPVAVIHARLPRMEYEYLRSVFPGHGNITAVTLTLLNNLITQLKENKIKRYDLDNEDLIKSILYENHTNKKV